MRWIGGKLDESGPGSPERGPVEPVLLKGAGDVDGGAIKVRQFAPRQLGSR